MDPDTERFAVIEKNVRAVFAAYCKIYGEKKKKQTKKTTFGTFTKATPQEKPVQEETRPGPSGTPPDVIMYGERSSAALTGPENLAARLEGNDSDRDDPNLLYNM